MASGRCARQSHTETTKATPPALPADKRRPNQTDQPTNPTATRTPDPPHPKGARVAKPPPRAAKPRKNDEGDKARAFRGHTSPIAFVEMAGIEPASNGEKTGLLRVQFASLFSAPKITRTSLRRAQSLLDFPLHPVTGIKV